MVVSASASYDMTDLFTYDFQKLCSKVCGSNTCKPVCSGKAVKLFMFSITATRSASGDVSSVNVVSEDENIQPQGRESNI